MKVTLFGGTGYLGSHAAQQLKLAGFEVLCAVRQGGNCDFLESLDVGIEVVDFSDIDAIAATIIADSIVVNCIAETAMHMSDEQRRPVEVELTTRLINAAKQAQAKRFIQLSTVMIYGFDRPEQAIDESYPVKPKYSYARIANERETALFAVQQGSDIELAILRPSNTLGKRDSSAMPSIMQNYSKGKFAVIGGGDWRFSCIDARDVGRAIAHLCTIELGGPEIFLAKAYDITWLDVKRAMDDHFQQSTQLMNLPRFLARTIGWLCEMLVPYGKNPPLIRFSAEVVSTHTLFDDSKIRATGFVPKYSLPETIDDALS